MFDYKHHRLPLSFENTLPKNNEMQTLRETRQASLFIIPHASLKCLEKMPKHNFPRLANELKCYLDNEKNRTVFKRKIKESFISQYDTTVKCRNPTCSDCS